METTTANHPLPDETIIRYSPRKSLTGIFIPMVIFAGAAVYLFMDGNPLLSLPFVGFGIYLLYATIKNARDRSAQLIINAKGIETKKNGFIEWQHISNDKVTVKGKPLTAYLEYDANGTAIIVNVDDFNIHPKELEELLQTYRVRSKKNEVS